MHAKEIGELLRQAASLQAKGQPSAAVAACRRALFLDQRQGAAHRLLGQALLDLKRLDEAVAAYQKAAELQADDAQVHFELGYACRQAGDIPAAAQATARALALRPDFRAAALAHAEVSPAWLQPSVGRRVLLRRGGEADADFLQTCFQNRDFVARYNRFAPRQRTARELAVMLKQDARRHPCQTRSLGWVICRQGDGRPVGLASLSSIQFAHRRAEFLIGIPDPADRTPGCALEATLLAFDFAFNRVNLHKLTNLVYADNPEAQAQNLAVGFRAEGVLHEHIAEPQDDIFIDLFMNGLTQAHFRENRRLARLSLRLLGRDITVAAVPVDDQAKVSPRGRDGPGEVGAAIE